VWAASARDVGSRLWLASAVARRRDGLRVHLLRRRTLAAVAGRAFLLAVDGVARDVTAARTLIRVPERTGRRGRPPLVWPAGFARAQVVKAGLHCGEGIVRRVVVGTEATVAAALAACHGGTAINTASSERLNATVRERLAPLVRRRRTPAHGVALVESGLHLLRLAYTFCGAHASLRLRAIGTGHRSLERTPAMAAGVADRPYQLADLLRMPAPPIPLTASRAPRRGRPSARGRVVPFPAPTVPPERSAA
jgi:IS1 family transposase